MSGNHNQSIDQAIEIVNAAVEAGTYTLKLQIYIADTMSLAIFGGSFGIKDHNSVWSGQYLHDLYKNAYTLCE